MRSPDVLVVGAGSAGCVLAARLSEDPRREVLLLEAGSATPGPDVSIPRQWPTLWDAAENWGYSTTLQPGYGARSIPCPRGKGLGGSSAINAMIYVRGLPTDFDSWRDMGNEGWGWSDVLKFFLKSEDQARGPSALHGVGGPMHVTDPPEPSAATMDFIEAAASCGHRRNDDFNGEDRYGAGLYQLTVDGNRRVTSATAFLSGVETRNNLRIVARAHVTRILFSGNRATGVEYFDGAQIGTVHAGEIVLSAGSIDSPRLLMLSGVGDPRRLELLGIGVHHALPSVGENLHDHPGSSVVVRLRESVPVPVSSNIAEGGLFMRSRSGETDIQYFFAPYGPPLAAAMGVPWGMMLIAQTCQPRSRGWVRLRSRNPFDAPLINPAYFIDPFDLQVQIEGVHEARRILASEPLRKHWDAEVLPGPAAVNDTALGAALRATSNCIWHPVGTCRMGQGPDAVVDSRLRVHGVEGLRVVDASVMPRITSGNTHAPTVMIAEKAAAEMAQ